MGGESERERRKMRERERKSERVPTLVYFPLEGYGGDDPARGDLVLEPLALCPQEGLVVAEDRGGDGHVAPQHAPGHAAHDRHVLEPNLIVRLLLLVIAPALPLSLALHSHSPVA